MRIEAGTRRKLSRGTIDSDKYRVLTLRKWAAIISIAMTSRFSAFLVTLTILFATVTGCATPGTPVATPQASVTSEQGAPATHAHTEEAIDLPHIHGIGFSADGTSLFVAAHDGLRVFSGGKWSLPDLPRHDYMGYSVTDEGFYSSGHPHPSSSLTNPLGLVKSTDSGKTLATLAFAGESDFHLMAAGYENHTVYVLNPQQNSRLTPGLHYTLDDSQTWQQSDLEGLEAQPFALAVHPTDAATVALATEAGLLLSNDYGNTFTPITPAATPVTAVNFAADGERLLYGFHTLHNYTLANQQSVSVPSPALADDDAISYVAISPDAPDTLAFATFNRDLYLSQDGGQTWQQIAQTGATNDLP